MSYEICPCCGAKKSVSPNSERDYFIRRLYNEGTRINQMVGKFFVGEQRLRQIIGRENLRPEDTNRPDVVGRELRKAKIMDLHGKGHSYRFIGTQVGLSGTRVSYIVRRQLRIEARAVESQ